jgi:hypothetical protein
MSQTEFDVCLVVETASMSLDDIENRIGLQGSDGSHDKGTPHLIRSRGLWSSTSWQLCSGCPRTTPLDEQFASIELRLPATRLRQKDTLPADANVYFSVGIFSDAQTPTATLSARVSAIVARYVADVEAKFYAT